MEEQTKAKNIPVIIGAAVIAIIVIVGGALYFLHKDTYAPATTKTTSTESTNTQAATAPTDNIYLKKTDPSKGDYLADFDGRTLYTYSQDTTRRSNCTGSCLAAWPVYTSGAVYQKTFPTNITVITRDDGTKQFAWKGMPLYYFTSDTQPGQITGDGVEGFNLAKY